MLGQSEVLRCGIELNQSQQNAKWHKVESCCIAGSLEKMLFSTQCSRTFQIIPFLPSYYLKTKFTYHTIYPFQVYNPMISSVFTQLCSHHQNQLQNIYFTTPKRTPTPVSGDSPFLPQFTPISSPRPPPIYFLFLYICQFQTFYINRIIQQVDFVTGFSHLA